MLLLAPVRGRASDLRTLGRRVWRDPLARTSAGAIAVTGLGAALGYATQITLARILGPVGYGTYTYSTAWLNIAQLIATLDLGAAALRFGGAYEASGAWGLLRGFIQRSRTIARAGSLVVGAGAAAGIWLLRDHLPVGRPAALLIVCIAVPAATMLALEASILQSIHRTLGARVPTSVVRPLVLLTALALAAGAGHTLGALGALTANAAALWAAALLSVWWTERVRPPASRRAVPETETGTWLRMALATLLGSVLQMVLSQQSDIIIAGTVLGSRDAGLYAAASQLSGLVMFGVDTVNTLAAPRFAAFVRNVRSPEFVAVVRKVSLVNWAVSLPAAGLLVLAGPWILRAFGKAYGDAYATLCVLLISQVVGAVWNGLAGTMLTMLNYHRTATIIIGLSAALNLALTAVLTPRYGIIGTASATTIATIVRAVAVQAAVWRGTGIWLIPGIRGATPRGAPAADAASTA